MVGRAEDAAINLQRLINLDLTHHGNWQVAT